MSTELAGFEVVEVVEKPDKAKERRYKRDTQELFWLLENWEKVVVTAKPGGKVWYREIHRIIDFKQCFQEQWGFDALIYEIRVIENRIAIRKLAEPLEFRPKRTEVEVLSSETKKRLSLEEKRKRYRAKRRVVKDRLRQFCHYRVCGLAACHF
ncbi:MAG: hypothetical protein WCW56_00520 [Candidatus Paceibacterota bacterium]|jgi:hypothetical protein